MGSCWLTIVQIGPLNRCGMQKQRINWDTTIIEIRTFPSPPIPPILPNILPYSCPQVDGPIQWASGNFVIKCSVVASTPRTPVSFGVGSHPRLSGRGSNFSRKCYTWKDFCHSWSELSVITAKSAHRIARTSARRLGHPARAGFVFGFGTKTSCYFFPFLLCFRLLVPGPSPKV